MDRAGRPLKVMAAQGDEFTRFSLIGVQTRGRTAACLHSDAAIPLHTRAGFPPSVVCENERVTYRSGFACFVGRPNAGKSTLTNALVGSKIVITSAKPQTTRHAVRGILTRDDAQLVLVDTPGLHRPRTLLGERLNDVVRATLTEVDVIGFCVPADQRIGPGDRFIAEELAAVKAPVVAVVTKTDTAAREAVAQQLLAVAALGD